MYKNVNKNEQSITTLFLWWVNFMLCWAFVARYYLGCHRQYLLPMAQPNVDQIKLRTWCEEYRMIERFLAFLDKLSSSSLWKHECGKNGNFPTLCWPVSDMWLVFATGSKFPSWQWQTEWITPMLCNNTRPGQIQLPTLKDIWSDRLSTTHIRWLCCISVKT